MPTPRAAAAQIRRGIAQGDSLTWRRAEIFSLPPNGKRQTLTLLHRLRQMLDAIFFAIAGDTKLEFGIVSFGSFTNRAAMERLVGRHGTGRKF
jgi:hypothetical protein